MFFQKKHYLCKIEAITANDMNTKTFLGAIGAAAIGLTACTTDIDMNKMSKEINYNTALVIPIGTARTTVSKLIDFIGSDGLRQDSDMNTCYLWWTDTLRLNTENIKVGDFTQGTLYNTPYKLVDGDNPLITSGITLPAGTYEFHDRLQYDFDYDHYEGGVLDQRVDSAVVNSAELYFKVEAEAMEISEEMPLFINLHFDGIEGLQDRSYQITQNGETRQDILSGFKVIFDKKTSTTPITVTYTYKPTKSFTVLNTSEIKPQVRFQIIDCRKTWGFFNRKGNITADSIDSHIPTDFFNSETFTKNKLKFSNPLVTFKITNGIGIPMDFTVERIKAVDANGEERYADFNGSPSKTLRLRKPNIEGDTSLNIHTFDNTDGHTERLFEITPQRFAYSFNVQISEFKNEWERRHWIFFDPDKPTSPLMSMAVDVKMPFQYNPGSKYEHLDTLDCDIAKLTGMDKLGAQYQIEQLNIGLRYANRLPVKAVAHAVLLDSLDQTLYTGPEFKIDAAPVDAEGRTTDTTVGETRLEIAGDDITSIWDTKKVMIVVTVDAQDPATDMIYFSLDDKLEIQASLYVKGGIKTNLDSIFNKTPEKP